jgi:predicted dehydrogenase
VGHPVKAYHGSTDKIANDPDVDLVVVSVRILHHRKLLLPATAAKKAVFIEWGPACANLAQITEVAEKASCTEWRAVYGWLSVVPVPGCP